MTEDQLSRAISDLDRELGAVARGGQRWFDACDTVLRMFCELSEVLRSNPTLRRSREWREFLERSAPVIAENSIGLERPYDEATDALESGADWEFGDAWPMVARIWSSYNILRELYADYPDVLDAFDYCDADDDYVDQLREKAGEWASAFRSEIPSWVPRSHWWWWAPHDPPLARADTTQAELAMLIEQLRAELVNLTATDVDQRTEAARTILFGLYDIGRVLHLNPKLETAPEWLAFIADTTPLMRVERALIGECRQALARLESGDRKLGNPWQYAAKLCSALRFMREFYAHDPETVANLRCCSDDDTELFRDKVSLANLSVVPEGIPHCHHWWWS